MVQDPACSKKPSARCLRTSKLPDGTYINQSPGNGAVGVAMVLAHQKHQKLGMEYAPKVRMCWHTSGILVNYLLNCPFKLPSGHCKTMEVMAHL